MIHTYFIGLLFLSGAIGTINGAAFGCLTFGIGLIILAFFWFLIAYLDGKI